MLCGALAVLGALTTIKNHTLARKIATGLTPLRVLCLLQDDYPQFEEQSRILDQLGMDDLPVTCF